LHEFGLAETVPVASAHDAVGDIEVYSGREVGIGRIDVNELGGEIGIEGV
jgi:hypothetical protein